MTKLNKTNFTLRFKRGLRASLGTVANYFLQGEPVYTTDTKHLFIADASYIPQPVATLDMAMCYENEVVCNEDQIVYNW